MKKFKVNLTHMVEANSEEEAMLASFPNLSEDIARKKKELKAAIAKSDLSNWVVASKGTPSKFYFALKLEDKFYKDMKELGIEAHPEILVYPNSYYSPAKNMFYVVLKGVKATYSARTTDINKLPNYLSKAAYVCGQYLEEQEGFYVKLTEKQLLLE